MQPVGCSDAYSLVDFWISNRVQLTPASALQFPQHVKQQLIQIILAKKEALQSDIENLIHIETSLASTDDQIQEYLLKNPQELNLELSEEMSPELRRMLLQSLKAKMDNMSYPNTHPEIHRATAVAASMTQKRKQA
ncbi:MAG: hypothetical protein LLG04_15090 [Parachlamydia sp.]|nr:hypothetical protein [Parachlamydia sp.]